MFCGPHNNYCGAGAQPAYTSDAGFAMDNGMNMGMTTMDNGMNMMMDNGMGMNGMMMDNGMMNSSGCNGPMVPTGQFRDSIVDCGTKTTPITQNITVPRTITTNRLETRTRTRNQLRTVARPVTKLRNETTMMPTSSGVFPVNRQVPYTDMELTTVNQPVTEQYTANVPTTTTIAENRTVTKLIQTPKKCRRREQIYARMCDTNNRSDMMSSPMMSSMGSPMMNSMNMNSGMDMGMSTMDMNQMNQMGSSMSYDRYGNSSFQTSSNLY